MINEQTETDERIEAGQTPPYIQSGMVLEHRDGSQRIRVRHINGVRDQVAVCLSSVTLDRVSIPCADIYRDYLLAVEFVP